MQGVKVRSTRSCKTVMSKHPLVILGGIQASFEIKRSLQVIGGTAQETKKSKEIAAHLEQQHLPIFTADLPHSSGTMDLSTSTTVAPTKTHPRAETAYELFTHILADEPRLGSTAALACQGYRAVHLYRITAIDARILRKSHALRKNGATRACLVMAWWSSDSMGGSVMTASTKAWVHCSWILARSSREAFLLLDILDSPGSRHEVTRLRDARGRNASPAASAHVRLVVLDPMSPHSL